MFDKITDSRDLVNRLQELTDEHDSLFDAMTEAKGKEKKAAKFEFDTWCDENREEWEDLKAINEEGEGLTSEWIHGDLCGEPEDCQGCGFCTEYGATEKTERGIS